MFDNVSNAGMILRRQTEGKTERFRLIFCVEIEQAGTAAVGEEPCFALQFFDEEAIMFM